MSLRARAIEAYLNAQPLNHRWHRLRRRAARRPRVVRFYHQVDDPQSQLLLRALQRLRIEGVAVTSSRKSAPAASSALHVQLIAVPEPAAEVDPEPELRANYRWRDGARMAEAFDLPLPSGKRERTPDRLRRAYAVLLGGESDDALAMAGDVGDALLGEASLTDCVSRYGAAPGHAIRPALEANYTSLRQAGHYEGGTLHFEGDWYPGVGRLAFLLERLTAEGLRVESPTYRIEAQPSKLRGGLRVYFSFRSPYSYLAIDQLVDAPLRPALRPVLPMVMRGLQVPAAKARFLAKDAAREAKRLSIPFGRIADPLGEGVERALAVFFAAESIGSEWRFAHAAMRAIWSEGRELSGDALYAIADVADLSRAQVDASLADDTWRNRVEAHRSELRAAGLYGVPSFLGPNVALWGQDRIGWI
ncbi:MAG: DsbA family protein [Myxococcota bacterium]